MNCYCKHYVFLYRILPFLSLWMRKKHMTRLHLISTGLKWQGKCGNMQHHVIFPSEQMMTAKKATPQHPIKVEPEVWKMAYGQIDVT